MNTTSTTKALCGKCNSFFASNQGLCSVCYQLALKNNEVSLPTDKIETVVEEKKGEVFESVKIQQKQEKKDACWKCQKKVGYLGFTCRCTYVFCNLHRHFGDHNCDFDYKTMERERLKKENPSVVSKKI